MWMQVTSILIGIRIRDGSGGQKVIRLCLLITTVMPKRKA